MVDRVFDLFAQVDRTLDRAQGGLGIGLALVRSLVALHGGSAQAACAGSLPLIAPQSPASAPAGGHAIDGVDRQLRVLVVDDNADAADSLSIQLEGGGHITRAVYNAPDGLAALDDFGPHIVFCDVGMPGMDGHAFAARLRADPRHADQVLVALTGWGADDDKRRTRRSGFDHHLVRPANWAVIAALLATL